MEKSPKKLALSGREIEQKMLRYLYNFYISLAEARPDDKALSRKVDCINYCREN
jgi:hypothetical protein